GPRRAGAGPEGRLRTPGVRGVGRAARASRGEDNRSARGARPGRLRHRQHLVALLAQEPWRRRVDVVEERLAGRVGPLLRLGDCLVHLGGEVLAQLRVPGLGPEARTEEARPERLDGIALAPDLHLALVAVAGGVVRRAVRADPVGLALDQRRAAARAGPIDGRLDRAVDRLRVVAVDLDAFESVGDRLDGDALARRLLLRRDADRPVIV